MQTTIKIEPNNSDAKARAENAFNISIFAGIIFVFIAAVIFIANSMSFDANVALLLISALFAFWGTGLCVREKSDFGILLVITGLIISIVGQVFLQKGAAIPTAIINIIVVSSIAIYTLPNRWIGRVIGAAFLISIATIIIDQYTVGVPPAAYFQIEMNIALFLGVIYLFVIAGRFARFPLRIKLIVGFLLISTVPLVALGWLTYTTSQGILQAQIKANLSESANATSGNLGDYVNEQFDIMKSEANLPDVQEYISLPQSERSATELEARTKSALATFIQKNRYIISCSLIDSTGRNLLDTIPVNAGSTYKDKEFFTEPFNTQKNYLSQVLFLRQFSSPILYFAVPILNADQQAIGVLLATYKADAIQSVITASTKNSSNKNEYTFVMDSVNFVNLGHSTRPDLLYKGLQNLDEKALLKLQDQHFIKQGEKAALLAPQPEIVAAVQDMDIQKSFQVASLENGGALAESTASRVPNAPWIVITAQSVSSIAALTQDQTKAIVTASLAIIIIVALIALLVSSIFTSPIIELTQAAEKVSAGDFTQKVEIKSEDEIGLLGATLNKMMDEIQDLVGSLEKRVADRTMELEGAIQQSEKRAGELKTISDISRFVSTEKDVEKLLPLITQTVSKQFDFYHVGIFLLNENKKFAVLRAANSTGGQIMLERQHKLEVGQTGIVGNVTATGVPRIALDTGVDAVYFNNPDLPDTHSEMALPLFVRGEVIGALDVQSKERNAFTTSDIVILSVLADQIAIAIENARLLEETKKALAESQSVFREYLAEAWQTKSASNVIGYYQTVTGGNVITKHTADEVDLAGEEQNILAIPITLRGQSIGALNILLTKSRDELTADQTNVIASVAERLGLALENARLFEETSSRAARERLVTDITTKIRGTNNPQEMIKTAMEELKRALGASRIEVVPKKATSMNEK